MAKQTYHARSGAYYYKGSSGGYDYFVVGPAENQKTYRVKEGEVDLSRRFPLSEERNLWVLIPVQ